MAGFIKFFSGFFRSSSDDEDGRDSEKEISNRFENFSKALVGDVMVPQVDVRGFEVSAKKSEVLKIVRQNMHSRYLVYRNTMDYVLGMVHLKDLITLLDGCEENGNNSSELSIAKDFNLRKILRKVSTTVAQKPALHLLIEMRALKRRMAIVVDEYGGLEGLITVNDLVADIVGNMDEEGEEDEYDIEDLLEEKGEISVSARIPIEQLESLLGRTLNVKRIDSDDPPDTIGGLISGLIERVPSRGEIIEDKEVNLEYHIIDADPRKIHRVSIISR